ncbi:MAG: aminotransferase class IV [Verrucomicrobiia bacterium]
MSSQPFFNINGKLIRSDRAQLPIQDLTFSRGYGAFESIRTYQKIPFRLEAHLQRLKQTATLIHLKLPCSLAEIKKRVFKTLQTNSFPESLIKIYITGGISSGFIPEKAGSVIIWIEPFKAFPAWQYQKGISLYTTPLTRSFPEAKSTSYLSGVTATIEARKKGFDEAVFVDNQNAILEGSTFNVFAIKNKQVITPEKNILIGITTQEVIKLIKKEGLKLVRKPISLALLKNCSELFITSSNREIIPAIRVNRIKIGNGKPGPITQCLHQLYQKLTG